MTLPVRPPLEPMLARLESELPQDGYLYEPKWDGLRWLAFRDGGDVDLRSRNDRPLARYFPEVVDGLLALPEPRFALDGELVAAERLRRESPARFVAFDVLALGSESAFGA